MAWTCGTCRIDIALDTEGCPRCGSLKSSWTIQADKTRAFAVDLKKYELWRGQGTDPLPRGDPAARPAAVAQVHAEEVVALPKATAARLAAEGKLPGPAHQLVVRAFPRAEANPTAVVTVLPARRPAEEREFPRDRPPLTDGHFDQVVVFVFGPGEAPELEGLHVVDVTDPDQPAGHVAEVKVTGLKKKKPRTLPVRAAPAARRFVFSR